MSVGYFDKTIQAMFDQYYQNFEYMYTQSDQISDKQRKELNQLRETSTY